MVQEAEKFRAEDEANKQKIEAKNGLENYCFTMRNTLNEEKLKDKFEGGDKEKIESAVQETLDWLDKNQLAEKDEFEAKQKELEGVVNPIMMKVYQAAGGGGMPEGGMPGGGMGGAPGGNSGPTVEEVVCRFLDGWSPELNVEGGLFQEGTYTFNVLVWRADETEADGSNASITVTLSSSAPPPVVITTPWLNGSGVSMQRGFSGSVEAEIRGSASCPVPEVQNFRWALVDSQERVLTMYDPQGFWNGTYSLLGLSQFPGELLTKGQLYEYVLVMASDSTFVAMQGGLIASLASATASGAFVVHSAPFLADGDPSCTAAAEPIQGFAVQTKFKLSATNVVDERVAELQYVFYQFPLAQLAALAADLGTAVTALEWSNYSSDSYWVSQGGVMLQDWSKASVVDSVLPVGDFVTVLRIRDYLGAVALAYLAGPNISAPTGGVDVATAAAALNSAVALNSANGILNTVDAVSSVDVNGTEEEINAVVGASMSALETASQLVAPDASTLQKVGNVLARTLSRGTSSTRDKAMLSRASEVVDTVLTTALQGSAQAISTDAGNAIMSGLVAITSANGEGTASASESGRMG
ncbi:unnamed protein product [Effrenium voratum]|nr:unnamed protein product [Effrenium voratum]